MTTSPTKHVPHLPPPASNAPAHHLSSPRSTPRLRKLQSAHSLSSNYAAMNGPSLISQQRQQQQRNVSTSHHSNHTASSQTPQIPPLPLSHSHIRARSNSDLLNSSNFVATAKRNPPIKKMSSFAPPVDAHEIDTIVRQGPRGDLSGKLNRLRHLILVDGLESDGDGMVRFLLRDLSLSLTAA